MAFEIVEPPRLVWFARFFYPGTLMAEHNDVELVEPPTGGVSEPSLCLEPASRYAAIDSRVERRTGAYAYRLVRRVRATAVSSDTGAEVTLWADLPPVPGYRYFVEHPSRIVHEEELRRMLADSHSWIDMSLDELRITLENIKGSRAIGIIRHCRGGWVAFHPEDHVVRMRG